MYTDPDGEFFIIDSWIFGFIHGLFSTGKDRWKTAIRSANEHAMNDMKIWGGFFATNSNLSFVGRVSEFVSRMTWQLPQTLLGFGYSQLCNYHVWGGIENISYYDGATVITNGSIGGKAVTLGSFINGQNSLMADPGNSLFQHEYGHYLQSQNMGLAYLSRVGVPSLISKSNKHKFHPVEMDANKRAFVYFNNNIPHFYTTEEEWSNRNELGYYGWDFKHNPLNAKCEYEDYQLNSYSYICAGTYDYIWATGGWRGVLTEGLLLGLYYNRMY